MAEPHSNAQNAQSGMNMPENTMMRMQQEALRRVRNMQERARTVVPPESAPEGVESAPESKGPTGREPERKAATVAQEPMESTGQIGQTPPGLLSLLPGVGSESILLLVLLLLLADEKADPALLMAVLYLIL